MKVEPAVLARYARVVVDTNVLISAALSSAGAPSQLVDRILQIGRLVFTDTTFAELETRIWLPKFDRYLSMELRRRVLREASASALWTDVSPALASRRFSRDTADDAFIHAAIAAQAQVLVTGDNDLLCLHPREGIDIFSPRAALDELDRARPNQG